MLFAQLSIDGSHLWHWHLAIDRLEADATCNLYPAMYEITGGIPEPIFDEPQEAESLGRTWQALIGSQTLRRRSSTRYEKGTGDPPKRHRRGNFSKGLD